MTRQVAIELALALAALEGRARSRADMVQRDDDAEAIRRYRGWAPVDSYDPRDIGNAISNAVRTSRRLARGGK